MYLYTRGVGGVQKCKGGALYLPRGLLSKLFGFALILLCFKGFSMEGGRSYCNTGGEGGVQKCRGGSSYLARGLSSKRFVFIRGVWGGV